MYNWRFWSNNAGRAAVFPNPSRHEGVLEELASGVHADAKDQDTTALFLAAQHGHAAVVRLLLAPARALSQESSGENSVAVGRQSV